MWMSDGVCSCSYSVKGNRLSAEEEKQFVAEKRLRFHWRGARETNVTQCPYGKRAVVFLFYCVYYFTCVQQFWCGHESHYLLETLYTYHITHCWWNSSLHSVSWDRLQPPCYPAKDKLLLIMNGCKLCVWFHVYLCVYINWQSFDSFMWLEKKKGSGNPDKREENTTGTSFLMNFCIDVICMICCAQMYKILILFIIWLRALLVFHIAGGEMAFGLWGLIMSKTWFKNEYLNFKLIQALSS